MIEFELEKRDDGGGWVILRQNRGKLLKRPKAGGNDDRGVDVGLMTRVGYEITSICSHVDDEDQVGVVFSRDCPEYVVKTPTGARLVVLVNHLKSKAPSRGAIGRLRCLGDRSFCPEHVYPDVENVIRATLRQGDRRRGLPDRCLRREIAAIKLT